MCLRKSLPLLILLPAMIVGRAPAQTNLGTITGIVMDPTNAVVPSVTISVTNVETGVVTGETSNPSGVYTIPLLAPGNYRLSAERPGFKRYEQTAIVVQVGGTTRLDFRLSLGDINQSVIVNGRALSLERETSDIQTTITGNAIEDLPLTSFEDPRNPAAFMQLAPGVTGKGGAQMTWTAGSDIARVMSTQVSGSMVSSTTLSIEGADIPNAQFEGDLRAFQIPPEAIGEFKLEANNADAQLGRTAGGSASFLVKSGTNQFHGSAYEFVRNDELNAMNFFQNASPAGCTQNGQPKACRPPYKQNEFGLTAGGPLRRDKAFVFGWYDGYRFTKGVGTGLASVPTEQMKQGNFTNYGSYDDSGNWTMTPIVDPITKTLCGAMICSNIVNPLFFDRVSKLMLPLFPEALGDPRVVTHNYTNTQANPTSVNEWGIKPDFVLNNRNRLSGLYFQGTFSTPNIPLIPAPLGGGDQPSTNLTRNARINWNLTPRPNLTNQFTLAWNLWVGGQLAPGIWAGKSDWVDYLGLKGFAPNYKTQFPGFGIVGVDCCSAGGGASSGSEHSSNFKDMVNWSRGRHAAKFGFEYLKGASNVIDVGNSAGSFVFRNQETGSRSVAGSGIGFASFLLGYADDVSAYHYNAPSYARNGYWAGFVQDDFKVARKLTLNLGLRYDLFEPDWEKYNHKSWVDYSLPNPDANNILGAFVTATSKDRSGLNVYKTNFSPRIGLAFSLNDRTVVRAAFGMYYAMGNANRVDIGSFVQGYNGSWSHASPDNGATPGFIWGTGAAQPFVPSLAPGAFLGQGSAHSSAGSLVALDRTDSLPPYMENYTMGVQRQLPAQMVLTVSFVGNTGVHLASRVMPWDKMPPQYMPLGMTHICDGAVCTDPTQGVSLLYQPISFSLAQQVPAVKQMPIDPATGNHSPFPGFEALYGPDSATLGQALRTAPQYMGTHRYYEGVGTSVYDALQVKMEKHFSDGLMLLVSYAWSKTLTDGGSIFGTFSSEFGTSTPWNARAQKAYSFEDIPHNLSIAYVYDLPVGKGKRLMNRGGVANAILGGWRTSGILQYQSGRPQNVNVLGHTGNLEDLGWASPDRINGVPMASAAYHSGHFQPATPLQPGDSQFNSAAFAMPCEWCFGTMTPTEATVRDFYWPNEDVSLMKEWRLHESWNLTFRADFFNTFNRHVFGDNNGAYATEPYFGLPGFGTVSAQVDQPRCIQFALKLKW